MDSFETEKLEKIIEWLTEYLNKQSNSYYRKKFQEIIMLLLIDILPIIRRETTIQFYEWTRFFENSINDAINNKCDAVIIFLPLTDDLGEICKVGVANPKSFSFGKNPIDHIDIAIESLGVGGRKIDPINL